MKGISPSVRSSNSSLLTQRAPCHLASSSRYKAQERFKRSLPVLTKNEVLRSPAVANTDGQVSETYFGVSQSITPLFRNHRHHSAARRLSERRQHDMACVGKEEVATEEEEPQEGEGTGELNIRSALWQAICIGAPALASSLCEPTVSMVEMWSLGHQGVLHLAAVVPGTSIAAMGMEVAFSFSVITTLYVSTTLGKTKAMDSPAGLHLASSDAISCGEAPYSEVPKSGMDTSLLQRVMVTQLLLFTAVAIASTAILLVGIAAFGTPFLNSQEDTKLASLATAYCVLRCLALPAIMYASLAEGCFVGMQDSVTPLLVFAKVTVAVVVMIFMADRFAGDLTLHTIAMATTLGAFFSAGMFTRKLSRMGLMVHHWKDVKLLDADEIKAIVKLALSYAIGVMARMLTYTTITSVVMHGSVIQSAAHKICYETYWMLSFFTEPAFTAANTLIPREMARSPRRALVLATLILALAVGIGGVLAVAASVLLTSGIFIQDPVLAQGLLPSMVQPVGLAIFASSVSYGFEGIVVGLNQVGYLQKLHVANAVVINTCILLAAKWFSVGLSTLWYVVAAWQILRIIQHCIFIWIVKPWRLQVEP